MFSESFIRFQIKKSTIEFLEDFYKNEITILKNMFIQLKHEILLELKSRQLRQEFKYTQGSCLNSPNHRNRLFCGSRPLPKSDKKNYKFKL